MSVRDDRLEVLSPALAASFLVGLLLVASTEVATATDCSIAVEPGVAVIEGHVQQMAGDADLDVESGALASGYETWHAVVAYYNPEVNGIFLLAVSGTTAVLTASVQVTDAEIAAAIEAVVGEGSEYAYTVCGQVLFTNTLTVVALAEIDHQVRSYAVPTDRKATAAGYNKTALSDSVIYKPWGELVFEVDAADIAAADIVTDYPLPLIHGRIKRIDAVCVKAVTTAAKAADVDAHIGATAVTGGQIVLAGTDTLGAITAGAAITAANTFQPGDVASLVGSAVTTYVEGRYRFSITIEQRA